MDENLQGEIYTSVMRWRRLVDALSTEQRTAMRDANLGYMLHIPPIMMRSTLIRHMIEMYDVSKQRFVIQENTGEVRVAGEHVEAIFGLKDGGLSAMDILFEEGESIVDNIPKEYLSKVSGNLVINDMIDEIAKNPTADDAFLRRATLVLIGTIFAPRAKKVVDRQYYALVKYVGRIKEINWNAFTRWILHEELKRVMSGRYLKQWPRANMALLQVYIRFGISYLFLHCHYNCVKIMYCFLRSTYIGRR